MEGEISVCGKQHAILAGCNLCGAGTPHAPPLSVCLFLYPGRRAPLGHQYTCHWFFLYKLVQKWVSTMSWSLDVHRGYPLPGWQPMQQQTQLCTRMQLGIYSSKFWTRTKNNNSVLISNGTCACKPIAVCLYSCGENIIHSPLDFGEVPASVWQVSRRFEPHPRLCEVLLVPHTFH